MADQKKHTLVIDDGTKEFVLENEYGQEICKLHVRIADFSIMERMMDLQNKVADMIAPLKDVDIKADGTAEFEEAWPILKRVEDNVIKELSAVFDTNEIKDIFKNRFMFSSVNGQFFLNIVVDVLSNEFNRMLNEEMKQSEKRMKKYLKPTGGGKGAGVSTHKS